MTTLKDNNIQENYKNILDYETKLARKMSLTVLEKPKFSSWMILIPIIIFPYLQRHERYKKSSKLFIEGYLHTKTIALDVANRLALGEIAIEEARPMIKRQVESNQSNEALVLNVYQKQIDEIELLTGHYLSLLTTQKEAYEDMVLNHYQTKNRYLGYIQKLTHAEKEVSEASTNLFVDEDGEASAIANKMGQSLQSLRLEEANLIFSENSTEALLQAL